MYNRTRYGVFIVGKSRLEKKKKLNKIYTVVGVRMTESFGARVMMLRYGVAARPNAK